MRPSLTTPTLVIARLISRLTEQNTMVRESIFRLRSSSFSSLYEGPGTSRVKGDFFFYFFFYICFTSFFVFRIADLPHRPGVVYYHLLLRRETRILRVACFSFRIGVWDLFVHRGQKSYTPTAFGKLWTIPGVRCM